MLHNGERWAGFCKPKLSQRLSGYKNLFFFIRQIDHCLAGVRK